MKPALPLLVLALSGLAACTTDLATVRTLEDLRRQPALAARPDWTVRVGLAEPGEAAGPWKLIYCLAQYTGAAAQPHLELSGDWPGAALGPVFFTVNDPARNVGQAMGKVATQRGPVHGELLFAGAFAAAWPGKYRVRVLTSDGSVLAERTIEVREAPVCYWQEFAEALPRTEGRKPGFGVARRAAAAWPQYDGEMPLLQRDPKAALDEFVVFGAQVKVGTGEAGAGGARAANELPGSIPLAGPWPSLFGAQARAAGPEPAAPLTLSLEGDTFVLRAPVDLLAWPDQTLLARWWVNGKAVVPPRENEGRNLKIARHVECGKEMRVGVGLPRTPGAVKAGDRIGLQLLYVPTDWAPLPRDRAPVELRLHALLDPNGLMATMPLLSSRLEFTATEAMLQQAQTAR